MSVKRELDRSRKALWRVLSARSHIGSSDPLPTRRCPPGFPPSDNLLPINAQQAVEHARRISPAMGVALPSAFDDLRDAVNEIERLRANTAQNRGIGFLEQTASRAPEYLDSAFKKLEDVTRDLLKP